MNKEELTIKDYDSPGSRLDFIPEGKVKLSDGRVIDKANRAFRLMEDPKREGVFYDHKGTKYIKNEKGVLHRYPPKNRRLKSDG